MILDRLDVHNVRNVRRAQINLNPSSNLIAGANGAGKTTLLEAVHLLVRGRSFRSGGLDSLISFGEDELLASASGRHQGHAMRIGLRKVRKAKVRMRMNETDVRQISQIAATVPLQVFLPDVSELVFGPPAGRRLWLDWCVFHADNDYMRELRSFQRLLRQRNAALRNRAPGLNSWTTQMAEHANVITRTREKIFADLKVRIRELLGELAPNIRIQLDYVRGWEGESLLEALAKDHLFELKYAMTRLGPHRSEVQIRTLDLATGRDVGASSRTLSRGQGKAVACAMKLAQVRYLSSRSIPTVVLIDDVASEFDENYGRRFFEALLRTGCQVIATTTQESDIITMWRDISPVGPLIVRMNKGRLAEA